MPKLLQPSFSRGELSPALYARVDTALYQSGLRRLKNMFIRPQGGASNRAGTMFVGPVRFPDDAAVLVPFVFSTEQSYMLEFSAGSIRVISNGEYVLSSVAVAITSVVVTLASRVVTTSAPHGVLANEYLTIDGVKGTGAYAVNGTWRATAVTATTLTLAPPLEVKGEYFSGGTVSTAAELAHPYDADELADLRFAQSADVLTITHKNHPQYEFRRLSALAFEFEQAVYENGPFLDANSDQSIKVFASAAFGSGVSLTATGDIFDDSQIGGLFRLDSRNLSTIIPWEAGQVLANATESTLGLLRRSEGKVYKCVTDFTPGAGDQARSGSVRPVHEFGVQSDGSGKIVSADVTLEGVAWEYLYTSFGVVRITGVASGSSATCTVLRRLPADCVGGDTTGAGPWTMTGDGIDTTLSIAAATSHNKYQYEVTYNGVIQSPQLYEVNVATSTMTFYTAPSSGTDVSARQLSQDNRTDVWAFGSWSEQQGYPSLVTYFGDRIIFAASVEQPQTVWGSKVGSYKDFGTSVPTADDDGLNFTMNARQINAIRDLLPFDQLIALTSTGAFKITDGDNEVLTPSTVGFKPQSFRGARHIRSVIAGDKAIFAHEAGRELRTLEYRYENDKFGGVDLSIAANHLLTKTNTIVDMDYAEEPHSIVHVIRTDGDMLALTYDEEQEVTAWGHYDTDGQFERVCVIPENSDSAVYAIVSRTIGGAQTRYIERFADREIEDINDGVFLDCAISFDGRNDSAITLRVTGASYVLDSVLTCLASSAAFDADLPPDQVILSRTITTTDDDGNEIDTVYRVRCEFVSFTSSTSIEVCCISDVPEELQNVTTTDWSLAYDTFSGLHHLEGETVSIFADGSALDDQLVTGAQIVLDYPASVVHVGLSYVSQMETLDINIVGQETVRANTKHIGKVDIITQDSRNLLVGPDVFHLNEVAAREAGDEYDLPAPLMNDVQQVYISTSLSKNGRVVIQHTEPLPMTVLAVIPHVEFGGSQG